jgi:phosphohistidine swiveling domain-containing protein
MGIHVIDLIMGRIEQKTGISKKYLKYLSFEEVGLASSGLISRASLQRRHDEGMILIVRGADYKVLEGKEAESIHKELEERLSKGVSQDTVAGQVASQGYAKGVARIILDLRDFDRFKEGEILVTGMTRPEFVPLMKKAAGIVTNEGGITCHAAIVSRELNKPCIIGTQNATKLIHDGDMVEVRANHGTVRILKRAD